jgi:hypothetical protein
MQIVCFDCSSGVEESDVVQTGSFRIKEDDGSSIVRRLDLALFVNFNETDTSQVAPQPSQAD